MNISNRENVMKHKGTERPDTGVLLKNDLNGSYMCGQCGAVLFSSEHKYESGSGWPAFSDPAELEAVELTPDNSHGMSRTEVTCKACGGHLGHVFDVDKKTSESGKWFCINSASLDFESEDKQVQIKGDGS